VNVELIFILLFVVATGVAIAARRLRLPYTVALVLAGLILGALHLFPAPSLTKNLLFSLILPALIFEAAFQIDSREFRENWITLAVLAFPGVLVSTVLVTASLVAVVGLLHLAPDFTWRDALVFGALISATDPVAVVALFRTLGAPRRLTMLLDGESLLNDGTAIVVFTLSLSLLSGEEARASPLLLQFLFIVGGGGLIGVAVGALASLLLRRIDDPMVEITITMIAAYGSFAAADELHTSGVIAAVAAGMLCGNYGRTGMSPATRVATESFWQYVTFALNSVVFLLIGLEVRPAKLLNYAVPIFVAYLVVTAGRAIVIVLGRGLVGWTGERFPWRWTVALTWGGLRGALPIVLALSVPADFRFRELVVSMTFGVALLSILVHGLTMTTVLRRLGVISATADG
jgi:CPA1 family monovalent cation:H+ antiporter